MPGYQQPCRSCGTFIDRDAQLCPTCASPSPFVDLCPACHHQVARGQQVCAGCGRPLTVACPACKAPSFVAGRCDGCGAAFLVRCPHPRCHALQFFANDRCTACGKKIKEKDRRVVPPAPAR
ncbi:MAG: zinc ribbon domain-containing protein [Micrococcales bacterium]|nr:zinc ribbon domain-containing protein [Micrococcales bacterium]